MPDLGDNNGWGIMARQIAAGTISGTLVSRITVWCDPDPNATSPESPSHSVSLTLKCCALRCEVNVVMSSLLFTISSMYLLSPPLTSCDNHAFLSSESCGSVLSSDGVFW